MWRYANFPHYSWMGGFFPEGIVSMLIWVLIIVALVYLTIKFFRTLRSEQTKQNRDHFDSFEILKMRYARGEISHEDYLTMKETLKQSG
jgi:putative membrane protein